MATLAERLAACDERKHPAFCRHHVRVGARHYQRTSPLTSRAAPGGRTALRNTTSMAPPSPRSRAQARVDALLRLPWSTPPPPPRTHHTLAIVAVIQNEAPYVAEWMEYHALASIGVTHFYLYDDNSDDELQLVLEPYVHAGLVTVHSTGVLGGLPAALESALPRSVAGCGAGHALLQRSPSGTCQRRLLFPQQPAALRHAVHTYGANVDWMAWIDVDEFLTHHRSLTPTRSVADVLRRHSNQSRVASFQVRDVLMIPDRMRLLDGLVMESALKAAQDPVRTAECTRRASPPGACRPVLWNQHTPGYWPGTPAPRPRCRVPTLPPNITFQGPTHGSGWWPKVLVRPRAVDTRIWTSIHSPTLLPPFEQDVSFDFELAHFRYRNFDARWTKHYADITDKHKKGTSKRKQLKQWRHEYEVLRDRPEALHPFLSLVSTVGRVRHAVYQRFRDLEPHDLQTLPPLLQTQVEAGRAFAHRRLVVIVGEGRSGTSLVGQMLFDTLPSFVYLYEPCRLREGLLHGTQCAALVARALSCSLSLNAFSLLLDDWGAFAKGRLIREAHALQGNTQQFPEEWSRAHHAPVQFKREALYTAWQARCVASHMAVKVIRIAAWPDLAPLLPLPSVRILHLLRAPRAIIASRLRVREFSGTHSEWNDNATRLGVVDNVCDHMAAKARALAEFQLPFSSLEVHYEALRAAPLDHAALVYGWLGFSKEVPSLVRISLASCEGARALATARADDAAEAASELARLAALSTPRHCPRATPPPAVLPALLSQALSTRPSCRLVHQRWYT